MVHCFQIALRCKESDANCPISIHFQNRVVTARSMKSTVRKMSFRTRFRTRLCVQRRSPVQVVNLTKNYLGDSTSIVFASQSSYLLILLSAFSP